MATPRSIGTYIAANQAPDPDPSDFVWGHRAANAKRRGSVDVNGDRDPVHDDLVDDDYHALPRGPTWRSFPAAADFEDRGNGGDPDFLDASLLGVFKVLVFQPVPSFLDENQDLDGDCRRHFWEPISFHDACGQDGQDDNLTVDPFFSAHGLGSPSFASPESAWFEYPASLDMSAFDDMPAWDDSPFSSSVACSTGKYFVDPALLRRPKRHIDRMGYHRRSFDAESYCCHLDSQERTHHFFDHVDRDCSRRSQQMVKMTALSDALRFAEHRLMPNSLCVDNPFDQDPAADERRMTDAMIVLAELAATAAADLLLLAFSSEAMSNLCCGLQGSSLGGSSNKLAPARLHDGVRERPPWCCPNWRQPPPLAMAA